VGVNTGETLIGNIGSKEKFGYDVLGDTVSTTARLEGQTKNYGVLLIMGPRTAELVGDEHAVTELDCIAVKGKQQGLKIYTVGCETEEHKQFLKFYYAGDWQNALILLENLKNDNPELKKYYSMMTERLSNDKPTYWSGVYVATSK
jgi:adenylate cyclase